MKISLDGYGSKIRKVNRCRPTVWNKNILATKQELLAPAQSITDIVLLGFWLILLTGMFISSCTTIYFFVKKFFFSNVYISVNTIFECSYLYFGWEIGHPLSMYVTRGMEGGHPKYVQVRTLGEGITSHMYVRTYTIFFCVFVLCCLVLFVEI